MAAGRVEAERRVTAAGDRTEADKSVDAMTDILAWADADDAMAMDFFVFRLTDSRQTPTGTGAPFWHPPG